MAKRTDGNWRDIMNEEENGPEPYSLGLKYPAGSPTGSTPEETAQKQQPPSLPDHKHGEKCATYFFSLMTEGSHRDRISVFQEEGHSDDQILVALLKTVLDSGIWHSARGFMDEAVIDVMRGRGDIAKMTSCAFCAHDFPPSRTGQRFCCNACAYRAEGLSPTVPHEDGCHAWAPSGEERA